MKEYMFMERIRFGENMEMEIDMKGNFGNITIPPLLLLPFIENSFSYIDNKKLEKNWINLEFQIQNDEFTMKLIHGKTDDPLILSKNERDNARAIKRLDFLYPGNYELKTTIEPEMMMTYLKIVQEESANENENNLYTPEQITYANA